MASTTSRQTSLLAAQDWTTLYTTFREANFQSYDFETIRKSMIDYLRLYYPEDFNDFTESSEFIALIDLIAFLGQSLAFRTDLNARENFLDTAERRDSILKLAKLISYTPNRNVPASGFIKVDTIRTTETVTDTEGNNIADVGVTWNDVTNANWHEQFNAIINAALVNSQLVGKSAHTNIINNIVTQEYQVNILNNAIPALAFNARVDGVDTAFEAVSGTSYDKTYIYEKDPQPRGTFNVIYKNDNQGNNSVNTGWFLYFKQGQLNNIDFTLTESLPNRVVNINYDNINNSDVWLYKMDSTGRVQETWTSVPSVGSNNVVYNSLNQTTRKIFEISSRANDQIDLVFGDGVFAEIPVGTYRLFFRQSNGLAYKITPDEMQNITLSVPYFSRTGRIETLTLTASLQSTVSNSSTREALEDIKTRAPQQYYTQNRMVNGEDYNLFPYAQYNNILRVKTVNRTSSGISRYLDVVDTTGKYSSTNIFGQDGLFYRDLTDGSFTFTFNTVTDISTVIRNQVLDVLRSKEIRNFFYEQFSRYTISLIAPYNADLTWQKVNVDANQSTGFFRGELTASPGSFAAQQLGTYVADHKKYITTGAMIKFTAPAGYYFSSRNVLVAGTASVEGDRDVIWTTVVSVTDDGVSQGNGSSGILPNGDGAVVLSANIPTGAVVSEIAPKFSNVLTPDVEQQVLESIQLYRQFGLRYDPATAEWKIITNENLNTTGDFSETYAGNTSSTGLDSSWLLKFTNVNQQYTVTYRNLTFYFESVLETRFYFDNRVKIFDPKTGNIINDNIKVLSINKQPDSTDKFLNPITLYVYDNVVESDGYEDNTKIKITYADSNNDGIPDDPDVFTTIIAPDTNPNNKLVFFQDTVAYDTFSRYAPIDNGLVVTTYSNLAQINSNIASYDNGQLFYANANAAMYSLSVTSGTSNVSVTNDYIWRTGRQDLYFQYRHNSPNNRRIDPSPNNIMDMYILSKQYDTDYRAFVKDTTNSISEPAAPTAEELQTEFQGLNDYKPISDTIIFSTARFKMLFGSKASSNLQAEFKVVKNPNVNVSDNEIKSRLINALNNYFAITNWDFGDTFYFSELSAYLHKVLTPNVSSVVLVPRNNNVFGSMYQITCNPDEIFINCATVDDVTVISSITATQLGWTGNIVNTTN